MNRVRLLAVMDADNASERANASTEVHRRLGEQVTKGDICSLRGVHCATPAEERRFRGYDLGLAAHQGASAIRLFTGS